MLKKKKKGEKMMFLEANRRGVEVSEVEIREAIFPFDSYLVLFIKISNFNPILIWWVILLLFHAIFSFSLFCYPKIQSLSYQEKRKKEKERKKKEGKTENEIQRFFPCYVQVRWRKNHSPGKILFVCICSEKFDICSITLFVL